MEIIKSKTAEQLGEAAAQLIAAKINDAIKEKGSANLLLSTGASQFTTIEALLKHDINWSVVTMFHLDEYIGLSESHIASFRKYLKERFYSKVSLKEAVFVDGEGDVQTTLAKLNAYMEETIIDVGVIGIGENAHIAFNDPPANFETDDPYIVVNLSDTCKQQQVNEGCFASLEDVPKQAISMSCKQIMKSRCIVSAVPHKAKANAIKSTISSNKTDPMIPATMLKEHENISLFIDENSASLL